MNRLFNNQTENRLSVTQLTWIKIWIIMVFFGLTIRLVAAPHSIEFEEQYLTAWTSLLERIQWTAANIEAKSFPSLADNFTGEWEVNENPGWTGGFWVGMLWLAYEKTGENIYLNWAQSWNDVIFGYEDEDNHDRGMVYFYSSIRGYELTGNQIYWNSAFQAARQLVKMQEKNSWVIPQNMKNRENIIIDTMMNIQLLWWAYSKSDTTDPFKNRYLKVSLEQSEKTLHDFIREDGSTWQSVHYDTITGEIIKKHTHQGFADSSCWSRGESWGLYGFLKAYQATGRSEFLNASIKIGDYIIKHLPEDGVPWYDYDDPGRVKDTSAGAIAAAGFLQLSEVIVDPRSKAKYEATGRRILSSLIINHLSNFVDKESPPGILRNGCYQIFKNADSETIWGDYYLMEALSILLF